MPLSMLSLVISRTGITILHVFSIINVNNNDAPNDEPITRKGVGIDIANEEPNKNDIIEGIGNGDTDTKENTLATRCLYVFKRGR